MFRQLAPVYHPCTECGLGYRRGHLPTHMAMSHSAAPTWWARFTAWLRGLVQR